MSALPRLLTDFTPAPGRIKQDYEDFTVEEIPLYPASGSGTHTYFQLEKRGLSTMQAVMDVARALNVRRRDIGYAGLKDARAVSRQWMSIEHVAPERLEALKMPRLRVIAVSRHTNKLRLGHLHANSFIVKVRQTEPQRLAELREALARLATPGVPNYFGQQRFGGRGDAWRIGRAILCAAPQEAIDLMLGRPSERDEGNIRRARELYERGEFLKAARAWPGLFREERRALRTLDRTGGKWQRAFARIDRTVRRFYISAYQSHLFNRVVARRMSEGLGQLLAGDLAWVHASGAVFEVHDAQAEQPRADAFDISPTGPLYGYRMAEPSGCPQEIEANALREERLPAGAFRTRRLHTKGGRRSLRFQPTKASIELGADGAGAYLELRFTLPRGCYATSLLRELFAVEASAAGESCEPSGMEQPPT